MRKDVYLAVPVVHAFTTWLGENLDSPALAHGYINRRGRSQWQCESLFEAYLKYDWRQPALPGLAAAGRDFSANAATLSALGAALHGALFPIPDDAAACAAATQVMAWGGVIPGNVRWLNLNLPGLAATLLSVKSALGTHTLGGPVLAATDLRFNAGMTKVYSLLCDELIIYDSRVAAALGWAVTLFCEAHGLDYVPAELNLPWAPAKAAAGEAAPKRRDPSTGTFVFQKLASGPRHAEWNQKASWLLAAALASPAGQQSRFTRDSNLPTLALRLRALEAALFMIGYDLGNGQVAATAPATTAPAARQAPVPAESASVVGTGAWIDCWTMARRNPFRYAFAADGLKVENGPRFTTEEINATLAALHSSFGADPFPLSNSVIDVPAGTARTGIGTAYYNATGKSPAYTSKLAAILEDLMIVLPVRPAPDNGLHWRLNMAVLQAPGGTGLVGSAEVLRGLQEGVGES